METILNIMKEFFEKPTKEFYIRELARKLKTNHTTIRNHLNRLLKENYLVKNEGSLYPTYKANINEKFKNLKIFYNLEEIRKSKIVEYLEENYDYPPIILFGSYSQGIDDEKSDIDFFIISNIKKESNLNIFEKRLKKEINLHVHSSKEFERLKVSSKELINSLAQGMVLRRQLKILK